MEPYWLDGLPFAGGFDSIKAVWIDGLPLGEINPTAPATTQPFVAMTVAA